MKRIPRKAPETRDSNHDELVAILLNRKLDIVRACGFAGFAPNARRVATIEWPLGKGFIDLAIRWERRSPRCGMWGVEADLPVQQATVILIEVKSERENWSVGDVIRQQKNHRKSFLSLFPANGFGRRQLWTDDGKRYVWPTLAFFCPRALTEHETSLLKHERFVVLPHEWANPSLSLAGAP